MTGERAIPFGVAELDGAGLDLGRAGDTGRAGVGSTYEQNRQLVPSRQARYRLFDVSWGGGCEKGAGWVASVRLGEQREKLAVLDGQAFIVASE